MEYYMVIHNNIFILYEIELYFVIYYLTSYKLFYFWFETQLCIFYLLWHIIKNIEFKSVKKIIRN